MAWKATGAPAVRKLRGRWVVWIDGFDTETGRRRPRQLGTYDSRRAAQASAVQVADSGPPAPDRRTVAWAVDEWLATRTHVGAKTLTMYEWSGRHLKAGLGSIPLALVGAQRRRSVAQRTGGRRTDPPAEHPDATTPVVAFTVTHSALDALRHSAA